MSYFWKIVRFLIPISVSVLCGCGRGSRLDLPGSEYAWGPYAHICGPSGERCHFFGSAYQDGRPRRWLLFHGGYPQSSGSAGAQRLCGFPAAAASEAHCGVGNIPSDPPMQRAVRFHIPTRTSQKKSIKKLKFFVLFHCPLSVADIRKWGGSPYVGGFPAKFLSQHRTVVPAYRHTRENTIFVVLFIDTAVRRYDRKLFGETVAEMGT